MPEAGFLELLGLSPLTPGAEVDFDGPVKPAEVRR